MQNQTSAPTVLLIEDDYDAARMVIRLLSSNGYDIHHAATGLGGLGLAHKIRPNLILVDLGLPDVDGKSVALRMRSMFQSSGTAIVAFTAETGARTQRMAKAYGCDHFISKPINTQTFPAEIGRILSTQELSVHVS